MLDALKRISTALGVLAATAAVTQAQAQALAPNNNQATATAVATALGSSPSLNQYRIEIETRNGMTTLTGTVATAAQKAEALGRRLPDRLPLASLAEHRGAVSVPRSAPRLARGHPAVG